MPSTAYRRKPIYLVVIAASADVEISHIDTRMRVAYVSVAMCLECLHSNQVTRMFCVGSAKVTTFSSLAPRSLPATSTHPARKPKFFRATRIFSTTAPQAHRNVRHHAHQEPAPGHAHLQPLHLGHQQRPDPYVHTARRKRVHC
jgi:hypothetical protein